VYTISCTKKRLGHRLKPTRPSVACDQYSYLTGVDILCDSGVITYWIKYKLQGSGITLPKQLVSERYDIHPDFLQYEKIKPTLNPYILPIINSLLTWKLNSIPVPTGLIETRQPIKGYNDAPINVSILSPAPSRQPMPALVYFHGGAFAMQAAPHHKCLAFEYALRTPCTVIVVDYRLLPKATYPVGLFDCYSAYRWVCDNAALHNIDSDRIAVGGDSAGGALAAGVCLLARDRKAAMPCFQMLIYPITDKRQATASMQQFTDTPLWNSALNASMWQMYLKNALSPVSYYASPAEAATLKDMPPTYVEVAQYDPLRDEGIAYAKSLENSGVPTELFETKRTVHGFEIAQHNEIVLASVARRVEKLQKAFA